MQVAPTGRAVVVCFLRKPHVFARVHLEIQGERILRVRLDHFLSKLHIDRVLAENCVFVHRLKIDGDEEWPIHFRIDPLAAFDAKDLGNFEELHSRVHHHLLHAGGCDLRFESVENDMVNHEGKANRRFPRAAQVRIGVPVKHSWIAGGEMVVMSRVATGAALASAWAKIRDKAFLGGLV